METVCEVVLVLYRVRADAGVERKPDSCYEESEVSFAYNTVDEIAVVESKSSTLQKATER